MWSEKCRAFWNTLGRGGQAKKLCQNPGKSRFQWFWENFQKMLDSNLGFYFNNHIINWIHVNSMNFWVGSAWTGTLEIVLPFDFDTFFEPKKQKLKIPAIWHSIFRKKSWKCLGGGGGQVCHRKLWQLEICHFPK